MSSKLVSLRWVIGAWMVFLAVWIIVPRVSAQLQTSGATVILGTGTNTIGSVKITDGTNTAAVGTGTTKALLVSINDGTNLATVSTTGLKVDVGGAGALTATSSALDINIKSGSVANTAFALNAGTAIVGFVRQLPSSCTQTTSFTTTTSYVNTGVGTPVTSTTTCVTLAYANNTTNSAVTLRISDKQSPAVIFFGGNADFSIPANSNIKIPLEGVVFTSGIQAIAGTTSAINLQINGMQ